MQISPAAGLSLKAGKFVGRLTSSAGPVTISNATATTITDTLMDDTFNSASPCGAEWDTTNDRFNITEDGIYYVRGQVSWIAETAGLANATLDGAVIGSTSGQQVAQTPFVAGEAVANNISLTRWYSEGSWVRQRAYPYNAPGGSAQVDYAELFVYRVG